MKKQKNKYMYGKFHHDTYEFHKDLTKLFSNFFEKYPNIGIDLNNGIVNLRNQTIALLDSWIGAKKLETKFGIKIPLNSTPVSIKNFLEKQVRSRNQVYKPCEICKEKRITHYCHIIPRADGGPNDENNYIYLCPLHHHLFDHFRLDKKEWLKINFSKKLKASQEYIKNVTLPKMNKFWEIHK